ncbi:DUF4232 domain-containing protein [Streptomyces sp. NPDC018031]|uniref:DUF4232 domain-containing protein n=1 Tax=Streptomyces sp. NPDC018031 TaxID=3365033 RepID=UPI0037A6610D
MRKNLIRTPALAAMALAAVLSLSACEDGDGSTGASSPSGAAQSAGQGKEADGGAGGDAKDPGSKGTSAGAESGGSTGGSGTSGNSGSASDGGGTGSGDKSGYGQVCGTNDLTWNASSETQAGGYILVSVKANEGITCTLPAEHPVVAFGSDGTEAGPAQQSVGEPIELSGATTAYAGVNPKTTNTDDGKELNAIIVAVSQEDLTDPVSLDTGSITVDKPIVTNWHTTPQDAVPGDSGTS